MLIEGIDANAVDALASGHDSEQAISVKIALGIARPLIIELNSRGIETPLDWIL